MRLFLYESLSAGGLGPEAPASLRREGWAMLRAVAADFARIPGVHATTLLDPHAPDLPGTRCDRADMAREPDRFRANAAAADATLVIAPESDGHLLERSEWVGAAGGRLLGALPPAVRLTGDKRALAEHWQARGVRTPATVVADALPPAIAGPWVCKPRHGAGSQATYLASDAAAWRAAFDDARASWPAGDLLAQTFVPGQAASVAFLVGPAGCVPLLPAAQRLSADGRFAYRGGWLPLPAPLAARALRLARLAIGGIAGLQGYAGVDLILGPADDGSADYAIEINPRLTTSYIGLRQLCRDNLAAAWLDALAGRPVALTWRDGLVAFGADGEVGIDDRRPPPSRS